MTKDYIELGRELDRGAKALGRQAPEIMGAMRNLASAAVKDGALDTKTKELMALAISITSSCDSCIAYHTRNALRAGATKAEVVETIGVALEMGGGPAIAYGVGALDAYEQFMQAEFSSETID